MRPAQLQALFVPDPASAWADVGFDGGERIMIGQTALVPAGADHGICAHVQGIDELDGLALCRPGSASGTDVSVPHHRNGVVAIDHIVVTTPDSDRTARDFERQGIESRRVRRIDTPDGTRRQTFFWLGDVICEVVGPDAPADKSSSEPARWWGLALTVTDIEATKAHLGDRLGVIKAAVQPGRRVATLRRSAGLSLPIMFISPHPRA